MSYSYTNNQSFSITNAKYLASKVAADLKRMNRFYGHPSIEDIDKYEIEITELAKLGYLKTVYFGFKRYGNWIPPTLIYTAKDLLGVNSNDDSPGNVPPNENVTGATFSSYLTHTDAWFELSAAEQFKIEQSLPFQRVGAPVPGIDGQVVSDHIYASGGKALNRSSIKKS